MRSVVKVISRIGMSKMTIAAGGLTVAAIYKGLTGLYETEGLPSTKSLNGFGPTMTRHEALEVLNLHGHVTKAEVQKCHRALMARHHPDKGGSPYIATKINEARDFLTLGSSE